MNTAHKFLALTFSALALASGAAQAFDGQNPEFKPFESSRTRAEVQAEAAQAPRFAYGEVGGQVLVTAHSSVSRAEVKQQVIQAAKAHMLRSGEVNL